MRLIVELDDEFYNHIQNDHEYFLEDGEELYSIVQNATPIPDNATNGDVISREAVRNIVEDIRDCISVEGYWAILERLKMLPSVKQEPKTGHWLHFATSDDCSECGWSTGKYISPSKYCPNCGAKMVEPQESEGKE